MKLSVVIPCYNANQYIIEMLNCCQKQSFIDWEAIVVDDGSTDNTLILLRELANSDSRIKVIERNRSPKGGDTCRNIGMEYARGEYLIIFDADDIISDDCFEKRVRYLDSHPECDYATFPAKTFIDYGNGVCKFSKEIDYCFSKGKRSILEYLLLADYPFTVWGNIYRREKLKGIVWDEQVAVYQDFDFMLSCMLKELKHEYSDRKDPDYFYRLYAKGGSTSSSYISDVKLQSTLYLYKKVLDSIKDREDSDLLKKCFLSFIYWHLGRIIDADKQIEANKLIETIGPYYAQSERNKMIQISDKCFRISNMRRRKMAFDFYLSIYCGYKRSIKMLVLDIVNMISRH